MPDVATDSHKKDCKTKDSDWNERFKPSKGLKHSNRMYFSLDISDSYPLETDNQSHFVLSSP